MGTTLEAENIIKIGGGEGVGAVLSGGSVEGARYECEDGSRYLEVSQLGSSYDMCGGD